MSVTNRDFGKHTYSVYDLAIYEKWKEKSLLRLTEFLLYANVLRGLIRTVD
jgi:hypothetical protein